jgi:ribosome-binding factor A
MSIDRIQRVNQLVKQEVAESLFRIFNDPGADIAAVTVTRVETSTNLRNAHVYVSILGDDAKQTRLLNLLKRHRTEVQASIAKNVVLKYTPHVHFELDRSIKQGDHVLDIIAKLEHDEEKNVDG